MVSRISAGSEELDAWLAPLLEGKPVISYAATSAGVVGQIMREMHNLSTLLVPIVVAGKCWGHLGVDDCEAERQWTPVEIDTLVTLAQVIGGLVVREQAQASLQYSEERFRVVSDTAQDAIVMVNSAAKVVYWNRAAEHIFGYSASEAIGRNALEWLAPPRYREKSLAAMRVLGATGRDNIIGKLLKIAAIRKGGLEFPIELSVASVLLRSEWHAVATIRDITERKKIEEQITYLAGHDSLTGLVNRTVFVDVLQQAIARANRGGDSFAVFYIDLDHFKDINDTLGHPIGDLLLQSVADRVRTSIRGTDTVARFGGDEFALIQAGVPEPIDAAVLASKLLEAISEPFTIRGNEIRSGASIGIAVYGPDSPSAEILLSRADVALYRAKSEGRGTYRLFNDAMDVEYRRGSRLAATCGTPWRAASYSYVPAADRYRHRLLRRRRSAGSLASSNKRSNPTRRIHSRRRAERADRSAWALGAPRGLPTDERLDRCGHRPAADRGERVGAAVQDTIRTGE